MKTRFRTWVPVALALLAGCASDSPPREAPPPPPPKVVEPEKPKPEPKKVAPPEPRKPAPVVAKVTPPAVTAADVARGRAAWEKGDLAAAEASVVKVETATGDAAKYEGTVEQDARTLLERARLAKAILEPIARSPLAYSKDLEHVDIAGGRITGLVDDDYGYSPRVKILTFGGVKTDVARDDVIARHKVNAAEYEKVVRERLARVEERTRPDDGLGHYRCAYYAWSYGLVKDAMPHVEKALFADDFPVIVRAFARNKAAALLARWTALTGKDVRATDAKREATAIREREKARPEETPKKDTPATVEPTKTSSHEASPTALADARKLYDKGLERYKASFGDGDMDRALKEAAKHLGAARDLLERGPETDEAAELQVQVQALLFDVRKRTRT